MADNWYYVQKGNRHGPVAQQVIEAKLSKQELKTEDFVWKKGFENWKKIKEVTELQTVSAPPQVAEFPAAPLALQSEVQARPAQQFNLNDLGDEDRVLFVRIGNDRGGASTDYGPFNIKQLKKLFKENRINGKTFIFISGMRDWKILADFPEYQEIFEELPPVIKESEKRISLRKPFVARLLIQNNKKIFEGICRDISIGGMQVLIDNFNGHSGDRITINVHPENTDYHFTASGVVVRILEGNSGFSFRFQGLSEEATRAIEKYVQEN
jgi:hypothetical protein